MSEPLEIELTWPDKALWPNGGNPHPMVKHRYRKAARIEAGWATKIVRPMTWAPPEAPIPVHVTVHAKPVGPFPDRDNVVASIKSHLDGIADALGVNDCDFDAPTVAFADRSQRGKMIVRVG